jgi:hypothetical protein
MLEETQRLALLSRDRYLMASTALSDLGVLVNSFGGRLTDRAPGT